MSLYRTIQSHVKDLQNKLYTTLPATVLSFDSEECTVKVQPAINEIDVDGAIRVLGELDRVPLIFPNVTDTAITFPIKEGDIVLLHFCQSDVDNFITQSKENAQPNVNPRTQRKHTSNDAFATIGGRFYSDSPIKRPDVFDIYFKDTRITINEEGEIVISNDTAASSITMDSNGDIAAVTASKFSVSNDSIELISLLSDLINTLATTTVNTYYGPSPLNSKAQLQNLKSQLDSMKV